MREPEKGVEGPAPSLSVLFLETGSFTKPEAGSQQIPATDLPLSFTQC